MKQPQSRLNIGTQARVGTRSNAVVSFLPLMLFAALVTALAFIG